MSARIFRFLYHFTVYAIGVFVLAAAVVVTLIRLVLPDIGIYRTEVEAWVSHYMGYPVAIRSLNATWYGWVPHLHLANVDLLNKAGTQAITHFESAEIRLDPVATLLARRFVPRQLTVSGFDLSVARMENGAILVAGIDIGEVHGTIDPGTELAEWLFSQDTIEIRDGTVEWIDTMHGQDPITLTDVRLALRSDRKRIQVEGSTALPAAYGSRMDFAFDATGDLMSSKWAGDLYLYASNINPDNWYRTYRPLNINIAGGNADIRVWSRWEQAELATVQGELNYRDFAALVGDTRLRVDDLGYRFFAERRPAGGWRLRMNVRDLVTENGLWPEANIEVVSEPAAGPAARRYSMRFDYLKLDDLAPVVSQLALVPEAVKRSLQDLGVGGEVKNGRLTIDPGAAPPDQLSYDMEFEQLATGDGDRLPRVTNASGRLYGTLLGGGIELDGDTAEIEFPALNLKRIPLRDLKGNIVWARNGGEWTIRSEELRMKTADFAARLAGSVAVSPEAGATADLIAELGGADVERLPDYVPDLPDFRLKRWLQRAVLAGRLTSAHAVLRGRLSDFPFAANQGRFEILANVEDVVVDYSDKWPPVDNLSAEIAVNGAAMTADLHGGNVFNAGIRRGSVTIGDVFKRDKLVDIAGSVGGSVSDLLLFFDQSPLAGRAVLGQVRNSLGGGDFDLDLELAVPLPITGRATEVSGRLRLEGAALNSGVERLALNDLSGEIGFTRTSAKGEEMKAVFYGLPVEVSVGGSTEGGGDPPAIAIRGAAGAEFVAERIREFFPALPVTRESLQERISGTAAWEVKIGFSEAAGRGTGGHRLEISSDLHGLAIDLPPPLGKSEYQIVPLTVSREFIGDRGGGLQLQYGSILGAGVNVDPADRRTLRGIALHFGEAGAIPDEPIGIQLSGHIEELRAADWWEFLRDSVQRRQQVASPLEPVSAQLRIGSLDLFNRTFSDVDILAENRPATWLLHLDGGQIAGDVELPAKMQGDAEVTLGLKRLVLEKQLPAAPYDDDPGRLHPRSLPALNVDIEQLIYDGNDLGHLTLDAHPVADGVAFERFQFRKPGLTVDGSGNWTRAQELDESRFDITVHAARFDSMLKTFGYTVAAIDKGETDMTIDASWSGPPMAFSLEKLSGSIGMRIVKGQLLDVNPKAGRLFGLLSIQTLPRRLSLDFTDLFGKGLAFDSIEGNFRIADGNAYTNDLYLRGPSANVSVTGRTGLAEKDYDQVVTVTPQITDSLPVAGALFGPVGIGVGAVLYLAGEVFGSFHDRIDTLLKYQYTITGSWDEPVIEKYERVDELGGGAAARRLITNRTDSALLQR